MAPAGPSPGIPNLFGRRLRAMRKMRNLTQEELGERAHVSGKFVGLIERGQGNPSLDVLGRLAEGLRVDLWQMLQLEESRPEGNPRNAARAFAAAEKVEQYLAGRPASDVERALRILEAALDAQAAKAK